MAFIFAAAVAFTALALALSAYFITESAQEDDALDKALDQSRFNLYLADTKLLPADPQAADFTKLLDALEIRGDFATLIETKSGWFQSDLQVDPGLISPQLAARVAEQRLGYQTVGLPGQPAIAVGGRIRPDVAMYFFYPQGERLATLTQLRNILLIGGFILAVLGAIAGYWLARRLVSPVRAASIAADRMSRGDLHIRLQAGTDEFGVLAGSFNRMAENLQAKMDDLEAGQARERRFVADVAHELRTPVSALVGEASILQTRLEAGPGAYPPEVAHLAQMVAGDVARLRQLVDDLLEVSRLEAKAAETVMEWVDMGRFVRQLVAAHGWLEVARVDGTDELSLRTDKRRVERILVNLIENALHHGKPPVTIQLEYMPVEAGGDGIGTAASEAVAAEPASGLVAISVTDSGPGVPSAHLAHIFDRFYKADPSRSSSPGSGLGLAIARENARLLGGDLMAENADAGGAHFLLTLPAGQQTG
ncbi:MAG: HAMP domain-containing histidine kinase [Actinobacteria bacterium]|nr:HAMP domain-containing histidine kinase [Actinomycetota bacterium]